MSRELWRTTLDTLRRRFEAAAQQYPDTYCLLIHAGPGERRRIKDVSILVVDDRITEGGYATYIESDPLVSNRCTWRHCYYGGEQTGVYLFLNLARDAGRVVDCESLAQVGVTPATINAKPPHRWVWSLFEVAWQRLAGSGLHAERRIWDKEHAGHTTFQYDAEALRSAIRLFGGDSGFMSGWVKKLPDYFCSKLPDIFQASVYLIDMVLKQPGAAGSDEPPHRPTRISRDEANIKAREMLKEDPDFANRTQREWAKAIGCSAGLVCKLPVWRATMEKTGRGRRDATRVPGTVSLTPKLEATIGGKDPELQQLIAEQQANHEPSPLEGDLPIAPPKRVVTRPGR